MSELKKCPFCNGNARVSTRQMQFKAQNYAGVKKILFGAQVICDRCHARGPLPSMIIFVGAEGEDIGMAKLKQKAADAWNERCDNNV